METWSLITGSSVRHLHRAKSLSGAGGRRSTASTDSVSVFLTNVAAWRLYRALTKLMCFMMNNGHIFIKFLIGVKKKKRLCAGKKSHLRTAFVDISAVTPEHLRHLETSAWARLEDKHLVSRRLKEMRLSPNIYHQAVNTIRWKPPSLICYDAHVMSWERRNNTFIIHLELLTTIRLWAGGRLFLFTRQESRRNPARALTTTNGSKLGGLRDKTNNIRSTTTRHRKSCLLPCVLWAHRAIVSNCEQLWARFMLTDACALYSHEVF